MGTPIDSVKQSVRWGLGQALPRTVMRRAAHKGDLQGQLVDRMVTGDPRLLYAVADEIRASGPVHKSKFGYVTASMASVKEVLNSSDFHAGIFEPGDGPIGRVSRWATDPTMLSPLNPPSLLVSEPPEHTRYRKLITRVFTVKAVENLRGRTQQIADELIDAMDPSAPVDLVERYCAVLPVTVIAEILGVRPEDRGKVLDYGTAAAPSLDLGLKFGEFKKVEAALVDFRLWLSAHLESVRANPGDNLLSQLVAVTDEEGGLDERELLSVAGLVLAAGFETTVNLLGNGIALLNEHPDQLALLRENPELWPNAIDEILRYDPPVLLTGRWAIRDTAVASRQMRKGSVVTTLLAGANRDPEVFTDPNRFDITRANARDHVSFSSGRHYCLGAALARMEGEVGLRTVVERFPDLRLLPGVRRRPTRILRGYDALPARLAT